MRTKQIVIQVLIVLAVLALVASCKASAWRECRATNSWLYCMNVLG